MIHDYKYEMVTWDRRRRLKTIAILCAVVIGFIVSMIAYLINSN